MSGKQGRSPTDTSTGNRGRQSDAIGGSAILQAVWVVRPGLGIFLSGRENRLHKLFRHVFRERPIRLSEGRLTEGNSAFVSIDVASAVPTQAKMQVKFAALARGKRTVDIVDHKTLELLTSKHQWHSAHHQRA